MNTFTHAGVSTLNGVTRVRFANDATRVKVLAKNGHTNIDIVELKEPLTKQAAVEFLLSIDFDNGNTTVRDALVDAQVRQAESVDMGNRDRPKKEAKKPKKEKAPAKAMPNMETIAARVAEVKAAREVNKTNKVTKTVESQADLDDAPF